jgi:hypothetical protein
VKNTPLLKSKKYPPWHLVEKKIYEEINWLKKSIDVFSNKDKYFPDFCPGCMMREIAILIVSGKIKAREIKKAPALKKFWGGRPRKKRAPMYHGQDWHRNKMKEIEDHFLSKGFQVDREPNMFWGRADLGVYKKNERDLLIEVGTTSFSKLLLNLKRMNNFVYLIVPDDNKLIEFRKL